MSDFNLRQSDRTDLALVVSVDSAWHSAKPAFHVSKNISEKGVFILAKKPPELEADVLMEMALPTHGVHLVRFGEIFYGKVEGRVVRVEDEGYAVQFEEEYQMTIPHWM